MRQGILHQMRDIIGIERLGHVIVGTILQRGDRCLNGSVARHHDYDQLRIDFMHAALQFHAIRSMHLDIHQRRIPALLRQVAERIVRVLRGRHFVAFLAKPFAQRVAHAQFVVYDQQSSLCAHFDHLTFVAAWPAAASATPAAWVGRLSVNAVPCPCSECTSMRPLCRSMMPRLMARSNPTPWPFSLVVINGSNIFGSTSGAMPAPSSRTWISTSVSS